uniref:Uncharacterized protein n=1 Tax=Anguilla anguilla TaxID=7936 RepID=A0A0E9W994_ANGAN
MLGGWGVGLLCASNHGPCSVFNTTRNAINY